jgi:hypothetical protein
MLRSFLCLDCHELAIANGDKTCCETRVGLDESDERRHLVRVRSGVVHHEQTARAKTSFYTRPPRGILGALGIEEYEIEGGIRRVFEHSTRVVLNGLNKQA